MTVLTLDLGTSVLKAALWTDGKPVAERSAIIPLHTEGTIAEQDPNTWWQLAGDLIRDLAPGQVDGIGVTAQMHAIVPTDAEGRALTPVPIVMDRRAQAEVDELTAAPGWRTIHEISGGRLDVTCVLPKLRHLTRSAEGETWRKATWLLPPKDFLRFQLTGIAASDPIDAAGTLLWNINTKTWDDTLIELAGIRSEQLPPVQPTLSVAGKLTDQAAQALGLSAGIPIVTGGGDDIETLGAGVLAPGDFFEHCGTTGSLYLATDQFILDPIGEVETYPDIVPGRWIMGASTTTAGAALAWARRVLALEENDAPKNGLPKLADTPGDLIFLPFLAGERGPWWNAALTGSWIGMRPEHTAADLYRAAVEGVFFSLHSLQASMQTHAPTTNGMVHTSGPLGLDISGAQARADLYGRDVRRRGTLPQSTAFAAAIITEATLTNTDPYALADQRLEIVWTCSPGPNQSAWNEGAQRYHQAASAAHQASQNPIKNS